MPNIMARTKAVMIIIFEFMCAEPTFIFLCVSEDLIIRACSSIDVGCTALEGVISLTVSFFNSIHVTLLHFRELSAGVQTIIVTSVKIVLAKLFS